MSPSLLPTNAKLQAGQYRMRLSLKMVGEQFRALAFSCITVRVNICYNSPVTQTCINKRWYLGISVEFIDCVVSAASGLFRFDNSAVSPQETKLSLKK